MAIVLSLQENMDLLLFLVKLAIALGTIAIALFILLWLRIKKIETRTYLSRKQLKSRFTPKISPKTLSRSQPKISLGATQVAHRPTRHLTNTSHLTNTKRSPQTQVYLSTPYSKILKKSPKQSSHARWHWLLAIAIASITGIAIALMQLGNSFISPEYMSFIWLLIGLTILMSATLIKIA